MEVRKLTLEIKGTLPQIKAVLSNNVKSIRRLAKEDTDLAVWWNGTPLGDCNSHMEVRRLERDDDKRVSEIRTLKLEAAGTVAQLMGALADAAISVDRWDKLDMARVHWWNRITSEDHYSRLDVSLCEDS